jgi:hypothetical protein
MQIIMNEEKIEREGLYDLDGIYAKLNGFLIERLEFNNVGNGFYEGRELSSDFARFGMAMTTLGRQAWFMDNVDTWLYFSNDDSDAPNDFAVEDFKEFCLSEFKIGA